MTELRSTNNIQNFHEEPGSTVSSGEVFYEKQYLGRIPYKNAEKLQLQIADLVQTTEILVILGLEHPLVLTVGYRADKDSLGSIYSLGLQDIPIEKSTRGGLLTIHNEGQLVIYPIFPLRAKNWGVKKYVEILLNTTQKTLAHLGISSVLDLNQVGVYTAHGKIAFCGLQVKNGVALHGISLNVSNDVEVFSRIEACGIQNLKTDKVYHYTHEYSLKDIFEIWTQYFVKTLN